MDERREESEKERNKQAREKIELKENSTWKKRQDSFQIGSILCQQIYALLWLPLGVVVFDNTDTVFDDITSARYFDRSLENTIALHEINHDNN